MRRAPVKRAGRGGSSVERSPSCVINDIGATRSATYNKLPVRPRLST